MIVKELRIGNIVDFNDSPVEIKAIMRGYAAHEIDYSDEANPIFMGSGVYEPIPLTHEWLEKCGAYCSKGYSGFVTHEFGKLAIHLPSLQYTNGRTYFDSWCIMENVPKSIHQLQNLHFALTGKELPINL